MKNTVRLYLPDGGSFDLPAGNYGGRLEVNGLGDAGGADVALMGPSSTPWMVIVGGAVLGGLFTWMLTRLD